MRETSSEHYSRRDIGELPKEADPKKELVRFIMRDQYLGDHEKPREIDFYLSKNSDELRQLAAKADHVADKIRDEDFPHRSSDRLYDRAREKARLLMEMADFLEKVPEEEVDPREAIEKSREIYQGLQKKATKFGDVTVNEKKVSLLDPKDPDVIRMRINEHESNGSDPELLVAYLEAYPNLKEVQKLGSLARNQFVSAEKAKHQIRDIETDTPFGDHRDEKRKKLLVELEEFEKSSREKYKMLVAAVKALRQGVVS